MRVIASLCLTALVLAVSVESQAQSPFQLGVAGGVAFSNLAGDEVEGTDSRTSGYFGGAFVWQPTGVLGFETGVHYVARGAESDFEGDQATIKLNYIEVPLLLRLALSPAGSSIRPVLMVGGAVAFKASCDIAAEGDGVSVEIDCDEFFELIGQDLGIDAETQSVDVGLSAALGADIPIGQRLILAPALRYTRGFIDVLEINGQSVEGKNSSFQLGVALRFTL